MRKFWTFAAVPILLVSVLASCGEPPSPPVVAVTADVEAAKPADPGYDPNVDYISVMIQHALHGRMDALDEAADARSRQIVAMGKNEEPMTGSEFLEKFEQYAGFSLDEDYMNKMLICCTKGDLEGGREAEEKRDKKLLAMGRISEHISMDDLYSLAKIITREAGSEWLSYEWKMSVGEVLLNRVASVEFPNTIQDCLYEKAYPYVNDQDFLEMDPTEACARAAAALLSGERVLNEPAVVYQSENIQGEIFITLHDDILGDTYLCYSPHMELYQQEAGS